MKPASVLKIIVLSTCLASCLTRKTELRGPTEVENSQDDTSALDPKTQMALTQTDEAIVRQYFDSISPNEEAFCPPNSFANGISLKANTLFCLSGKIYQQKDSQTFTMGAENTLICPAHTAAIAIKSDKDGKPIQIRCHQLPDHASKDMEDSVLNTADSDSSYYCEGGSYLKGVQLAQAGTVSGVICGKVTHHEFNGLNLADIKPASGVDLFEILNKAKKVELRSKYLSLSGDYYVFADGRQVAIADGTLFSFGFEYNLSDLKQRFYLRIKENIFSLLSTYKISELKDQKTIKIRKIEDTDVTTLSYFQVPFELAWGLYFKWYNPSESKLATIDQKNLTFLQAYDIKDNNSKKIYFIEQKFHMLRQVFTIKKLADSAISMSEMVLATVIFDRHLARQRNN